jgi:ribosomal protein S18
MFEKYFLQSSILIRSNNISNSIKKHSLPSTLPYTINYKNVHLLRRYIGITGKILPRYTTKLTAKEHRSIAKAIRQARRIGLLPFVWLTHLFFLVFRVSLIL